LYYFPEGDGNLPLVSSDKAPDPVLESHDAPNKTFQVLKRAIDIVASLAALTLLSPLFIVIPILVKLTSTGPVRFRQTRLAEFGRPFTFLKFRSMYLSNDNKIHEQYTRSLIQGNLQADGGVFKIRNDPRVTSVGRFLRASSLDELPQLLNVLAGK